MENVVQKDSLKETIAKVLAKNENEKLVDNSKKKSCKRCGKGNSPEEKKCRSCDEVKGKVSPLILISLTVFAFMVYGIYKAVIEIISSFSQ